MSLVYNFPYHFFYLLFFFTFFILILPKTPFFYLIGVMGEQVLIQFKILYGLINLLKFKSLISLGLIDSHVHLMDSN